MGLEDRKLFLQQKAKQLELLSARMIQCDSVVEVVESRSHFWGLSRMAGNKDLTPRSVEWEKCFEVLEPRLAVSEYVAGRRTVDFFGICQSMSKIAKTWEARLIAEENGSSIKP